LQKELVPYVECKVANLLTVDKFDMQVSINTADYLNALTEYYQKQFDSASKRISNMQNYLSINKPKVYQMFFDTYYNDHLADMVKKVFEKEKNKLLVSDHRLVQQIDPIYLDPRVFGKFDFRAHLFAPRKHFMGKFYDTYWFNMAVIWCFTIFLYLMLYFEVIKNILDLPEKIKMRRKK